jgi:hypothetical protein
MGSAWAVYRPGWRKLAIPHWPRLRQPAILKVFYHAPQVHKWAADGHAIEGLHPGIGNHGGQWCQHEAIFAKAAIQSKSFNCCYLKGMKKWYISYVRCAVLVRLVVTTCC